MSKIPYALNTLQVTLSSGEGTYELKKNGVIKALKEEFPGMKKGYGWFGILQRVYDRNVSISLYPKELSRYNMFKNYVIDQASITGKTNLTWPFKGDPLEEYAVEALLSEPIEGLEIFEVYEDEVVGYGKAVHITGKKIPVGKRVRTQVKRSTFENDAEFLQGILSGVSCVKQFQEDILTFAKQVGGGPEFGPLVGNLQMEAEHYETMLDRTLEELDLQKKEETTGYYRDLFVKIRSGR